MNKILLVCLAAVAVMAITVRWTEAVSLVEDFVLFPNLKMKRDLEMEEFLKDGNMHHARMRAARRQRRANEEKDPEFYHRYRRSLMEDEDEEDEVGCSAMETMDMKRSADGESSTPLFTVNYVFESHVNSEGVRYDCSPETKERVIYETDVTFKKFTCCAFKNVPDRIDAHLYITCESNGNFAPIGIDPQNTGAKAKRLNLYQSSNSAKASKVIIRHELGHVCGMLHTQQACAAKYWVEVNEKCVKPGYLNQYTRELEDECEKEKLGTTPLSLLEYRADAFIDLSNPDCTETLVSAFSEGLKSDVFAAFKEMYHQDVHNINRHCVKFLCDIDPKDLYSDETFMIENGECRIAHFSPSDNVQYETLRPNVMKTIRASPGETVVVECLGETFKLHDATWAGIPLSRRCRTEAAMLIVARPNEIGFFAFVCDPSQKDQVYNQILITSDYLYIDASNINSGYLDAEVSCWQDD